MKNLVTIILGLLISSASFGHGNPIEAVDLAVATGLEKFSTTESQQVISKFQGVKSWMSGSKVKVRVYVKDMDAVNYECAMAHGEGEEEKMDCTKL